MKFNLSKFLYSTLLTMLILGFGSLGFIIYDLYYKPMILAETNLSIIQVDKNSTAYSFIHTLKERHFIQFDKLFLMSIRLQNLTHQLKAGVYQIHIGESAQQFLIRVINGDVLKKEFCIIEGTNQSQIAHRLSTAEYLNYNENDWQSIANGLPNAEGLLLADTYQYNAGGDSKVLLQQAHLALEKYLNEVWQTKDKNLPYNTPYELLTAASIIEKETADPNEKKLISGIIINRLHKNMLLQMDPTVIYAMGPQYNGKLTKSDLKIDSPYNSYRYKGLPPTPIAMVGKDALNAAAHPANTQYLYFVARGDGRHDFSVTYEQQRLAIERYKKNKDK